jgi:hypothetical protein
LVAVLTEIYLCNPCACQEILSHNTVSLNNSCDTDLGVINTADVVELVDQYPELPIRLAHFVNMGKKLGTKGHNRTEMYKLKCNTLLRAAVCTHGDQVMSTPELVAARSLMARVRPFWRPFCSG